MSPSAGVAALRRVLRASPAAPAPGGRDAGLGLSGRPGQRRAVRATAVALALLALALGVRDAARNDPAPRQDPAPARTGGPVPADPGEGGGG